MANVMHTMKIKPKPTELSQVRGIPYRCAACWKIQIDTAYRSGPLVNCNRSKCHGDDVRPCGPLQYITIVVYSPIHNARTRRALAVVHTMRKRR